jgi:hypothetical protein
MPFFSVFVPEKLKKKHPVKWNNFKNNKNKLISPFDIYSTIREITCLSAPENNDNNRKRSISLLDRISNYRNCADIGISDHYCICVEPWIKRNVDDLVIIEATHLSIDAINEMTSSIRHLCVTLELKKITLAESLKKASNNFTLYKIEFTTFPNNGIYEVLIYGDYFTDFNFHSKKSLLSIKNRNDISRIDAYGTEPACVSNFNNNPAFILDLRKFCYCKTNLKKKKI